MSSSPAQILRMLGTDLLGLAVVRMFVPHAFTQEPWRGVLPSPADNQMLGLLRTRMTERPEDLPPVLTAMARQGLAALCLAASIETPRGAHRWLDRRIEALEKAQEGGAACSERAAALIVKSMVWEMDAVGVPAPEVSKEIPGILSEAKDSWEVLVSLGLFCANMFRYAVKEEKRALAALDDQAREMLPPSLHWPTL